MAHLAGDDGRRAVIREDLRACLPTRLGAGATLASVSALAEPAGEQPASEEAVSEDAVEPASDDPEPSLDDLADATVTVSVTRRPRKEVSRTSLSVAEIEKVPGV